MEGSVAMPRPINKTGAWRNLWLHTQARRINPLKLREAFKNDQKRSDNLSVELMSPEGTTVEYDYSRQLVTSTTMRLLLKLADAAGLKGKIEAMFNGEKINVTENRAVLHTALRQSSDLPVMVDGKDVMPGVKKVLADVKQFSKEIHDGTRTGVSGKKIKNVVAIGIGGSYLGPAYLAEACEAYADKGMTLRFVANVDGSDFAKQTKDLDAEETMFIIVSKTFTTAETMMNAQTAKAWMISKLSHSGPTKKPDEVIRSHFIAVSTAADKVEAFGIDTANMFGFWDWVGGRYSATSAVGAVPLSLFLGYEKFEQILRGAEWMDQHFRTAEFSKNIPVLSALVDVLNINFLGFRIRALLPYSQRLAKFPGYTQQGEMESNGKRVDLFGRVVSFFTGEAVFGEAGTNGQHSFYQLLHQGVTVPADFIAFRKAQPGSELGKNTAEAVSHQNELNANVLAQADALAFGKNEAEVRADLQIEVDKGKITQEKAEALVSHKIFTGNRPSSTMIFEELTPFVTGALLALTEHRTAVKGFIWGLNSFDQWGVELGKALGVDIRKRMLGVNAGQSLNTDGLVHSTARMLKNLLHIS
ncbi:MAG: glucose-6-phosphate isomerase [bacterium]